MIPSNDGLTLGCPASPAAFSVEEFFWLEVVRAGVEATEAIDLFAYLNEDIRAMEAALAKARMVVNQMKGTVWTSTGHRESRSRVGQRRR